MSVILDALHKARGDRRKPGTEPHEQTVARVVDAGLAPQNALAPAPPRSGGRGWVIAMGVIFGTLCLIALIGGAFFLLYDQMRRIETVATQPVPAAIAAPVAPAPAVTQVPAPPVLTPAAVLQTPVPLTELPVQAPSAAAANATDVVPAFELGSIVCESNDCIASLNGRSVRRGDIIKGYKVTAIDSTSVTLKSETSDKQVTLSLFD